MTAGLMPVAWAAREPPLPPVAVAAEGEAALALARRLLDRDDAALARLRGVAGDRLLIVLAAAQDLPWVDGASYLGRDPAAPALLLPTLDAPQVHPALLERALLAKAAGKPPPLAVLLAPPRAVPLGEARGLSRDRLAAWLSAAAAARSRSAP
jgi:hypothetical protein